MPAWGEAEGAGNDAGGGGKGKGKGKVGGGEGGQSGATGVGREGERVAGGSSGLVREALKAADMLQAEGLLKHCLEAFRGGLTVHTAIEHLVWVHKHGYGEARGRAMAYTAKYFRAIQLTEPSQAACRSMCRVLAPCHALSAVSLDV
jgi:hypothetical protein